MEHHPLSVKSEKNRFALVCGILTVLILALAVYGFVVVRKPARVTEVAAMETAAAKATAEQSLPEVVFYDQNGDSVQLADFSGKVILVNLWATWCTPCVAELPALDALQSKMKDKNFEVVAISMDRDDFVKVKTFLAERDIDNIVSYWDRDKAIALKWKYAGLPSSFLIDAKGQLVEKFEGPREWDSEEMIKKISAQTR